MVRWGCMSDDDAKVPASAASPMPAASLDHSSLDDALVDGQRPVVIAAYNSPIEAQLARSRLEAEDIPADLVDEHTVSIGTHLALAVGGVKVRVLEGDVERAQALLAQVGEFQLVDNDEDDDEEEDEDSLVPRAPPDELATRALSSGVIGAIFFPPLNLYSLYLTWLALADERPLTPRGRRKALAAVVFDVVGLAWLAFLLRALT